MSVPLWLFLVLNRKRTDKTWLLLPLPTLIVFESLSRNDACNSNGNHYLCCRRQNEAHINSPTIKAFWYLLWIILLILWFWPWLVVHIIDNIEMKTLQLIWVETFILFPFLFLYVYYMNLLGILRRMKKLNHFNGWLMNELDILDS